MCVLCRVCRVLLQTLDTEEGVVLQTVPIVQPVSVQATVRSKRHATSGHPYTHVQCNVDTVRAFMSITKYQTTANILLSALTSFLNPADAAATGPSAAGAGVPENGAALAPSPPQAGAAERFVEISLQHLDVTIVSDYIEELELFFIYMKVATFFFPFLFLFPSPTTRWVVGEGASLSVR